MKSTTEKYIRSIAEYFKGQPVLRAWLFGSYSMKTIEKWTNMN